MANFSFKKLLPRSMRETRWGELMEAVQDVSDEIKTEKIDIIMNQYDIDLATVDNLKDMAYFFGFNLLTLTGYSESLYYLKKEISTITKRIKWKNTRKGYQYILYIFDQLGEIYLTYLKSNQYLLVEYATWKEIEVVGVDTLDQESDNILYYLYGAPVYTSPAHTGLLPSFLDTDEFPYLDMLYTYPKVYTRHLVFDYKPKFVENQFEFLSLNTLKVLKNDIDQMHRKTETIHYQAALETEINIDGSLTEKVWPSYDNSISAVQRSICMQPDLSTVVLARFGNNSYPQVNSGITDVNSYVWGLSGILNEALEIGVKDTQLITSTDTVLEFNTLIEQRSKLPTGISEVALIDTLSGIVAYSQFPTIQWDEGMYSSLRMKFTLV